MESQQKSGVLEWIETHQNAKIEQCEPDGVTRQIMSVDNCGVLVPLDSMELSWDRQRFV